MFHVRRAREEDLPAVSRLAAELVRMHHRLDPPRFLLVEPLEEGYQWFFTRELRRAEAVILVAELDQPAAHPEVAAGIAGYAYGTLEPRNWNDLLDACGKLNDLFVHESLRRHGVGRKLVLEALAALRAQGAPRVVLMSAWQNAQAQAAFERLGFRRTMVEMTRELTDADAPAR